MAMTPTNRQMIVNTVIVIGLAIMRWRGAPWLAIAITAVIALPLANTLMLLKRRRVVTSR